MNLVLFNLTFLSTSRYHDDLLNIDDPYYEQMVSKIQFCWALVKQSYLC